MVTVDRIRVATQVVLEDEPIVFAYLFGSTARGAARPGSDVDIAVMVGDAVAEEDRLRLVLRLGRLLEQSLRADVDVLALNDAPLRVAGRVLASREVVYSADEPARVRYETTMRPQVFDFEHHARALDREFLALHAQRRR